MTDHSELVEQVQAAAEITGDELLQAAASALSSQSLSLSEAREEIERLRGESANLAACCETMEAECVKWVDRVNAAEKALKTFVAHYPMGINPFLDDAFRAARSALENGPAGLADATNDPASSDLSSLRKGAEYWRDINTAPKDGTLILVPGRYGLVTLSCWWPAAHLEPDHTLRGDWDDGERDEDGGFTPFAPKVWMPAPEVPAALVSGSREDNP